MFNIRRSRHPSYRPCFLTKLLLAVVVVVVVVVVVTVGKRCVHYKGGEGSRLGLDEIIAPLRFWLSFP